MRVWKSSEGGEFNSYERFLLDNQKLSRKQTHVRARVRVLFINFFLR